MPRKSASVESPVNVDREEVKKANFKRLMNARLDKLSEQFDSVENTTNPSSYSWTKEQADAVMALVDKMTSSLRAKLGEGSDSMRGDKAKKVVNEVV